MRILNVVAQDHHGTGDRRTTTTFHEMRVNDASELAALLTAARAEYIKDFFPFRFDAETISDLLRRAVADRYWAIRCGHELAGFCMLRGFDAGYARPSFGVFVSEAHSGRGLARHALNWTLKWAQERQVTSIMLKVERDNLRAHHIYESAGFRNIGLCPDSGHLIMEIRLNSPTHERSAKQQTW